MRTGFYSILGNVKGWFELDFETRPRVSYGFLPLEVDVLRGAKVSGKWDTVEQLAHLALVHRCVIEQS